MKAPNNNHKATSGSSGKLRAGVLLLLGLLLAASRGAGGEALVITEPQVKALCLLNFAKYTDWPADAFVWTNSPIVIGVVGGDKFADTLKLAVAGRSVNGRGIEVLPVAGEEDYGKCQVLFIAASEKKRAGEILDQVKGKSILTVGESDQFTQQGGTINFVKKEGKVHFTVDLDGARKARLQFSSKLLSLADVVTGKSKE